MNLRVFYLTRWGLSDGYKDTTCQRTPPRVQACLAPNATASAPRDDRLCSQRRPPLLPGSAKGIGLELSGRVVLFQFQANRRLRS